METRLLVLGPVRVESGGDVKPLSGMVSKLAGTLAASCPHGASSETLTSALWGEAPPKSCETRIRQLVGKLRVLLGKDDAAVEAREAGGYRLNTDRCRVDALDFERLVLDSRTALDRGDVLGARSAASSALELWAGDEPVEGGPSLGIFDAWRNKLAILQVDAARRLVESSYQAGLFGEALDAASSDLVDVAADSAMTRHVMRSCLALGDPAGARSAFRAHELHLKEHVGTEPPSALVRLNDRLGDVDARSGLEERTMMTLPARFAESPFVERQSEAALFDSCIRDLIAPRLIVVQGPSGIGKSRFAVEMLSGLESSVTNILYGQGGGASRPMALWADVLARMVVGVDESDWLHVLRPMSGSVVRSLLLHEEELVTSHEIARAVSGWIRARSDPTHLLVDDLHLLDPDSLEVLAGLLMDPTLTTLSVIATFRDDTARVDDEIKRWIADLSRADRAAVISIPRLTGDGCEEIGNQLGLELTPSAIETLMAETAGNAFYVMQLLSGSDGTGTRSKLHLELDRRIGELSSSAREALEFCSVLGDSFTRLAVPEGEVEGISECADAGLLNVGSEAVSFTHGIVRRHLYEVLSTTRRESMHATAAEHFGDQKMFIEAAAQALAGSPAVPLATAADFLITASDSPVGRVASLTSAGLIREVLEASSPKSALEPETKSALRIELACALENSDQSTRSKARKAAAESIEARQDSVLAARFVNGSLARHSGGDKAAIDLAEQALEWQADAESTALLQSRLSIEICDLESGDRPARLAAEALEAARVCSNPELLAAALRSRITTGAVALPDPSERLVLARELTLLGLANSNPDWELIGRVHQAMELVTSRQRRAAEEQVAEVSRLAAERQRPRYLALAHSFQIAIATASGDSHLVEGHLEAIAKLVHLPNHDFRLSAVGHDLMLAWHEEHLPDLAPFLDQTWSQERSPPVHGCALAWTLAETDPGRARAVLRMVCGDDFSLIPRGSLYAGCLAIAALTAATIGDRQLSEPIAALLAPLAGTDLLLGAGVGVFGPADALLAMLSDGDSAGLAEAMAAISANRYRNLEDRFAAELPIDVRGSSVRV